ncbi:MAG: undecaprenyl-diphosphate phosphatase [Candidatus Njordarchaeia archaeon]
MDLIFAVIAGVLQGVLEWIPISSEGFLFAYFSLIGLSPLQAFFLAIFFHIPTALAAILYFWGEYREFLSFKWIKKRSRLDEYLIIATVATAITAVPLYLFYRYALSNLESLVMRVSYISLLLVGLAMIVTAIFVRNLSANQNFKDLYSGSNKDFIYVGLIQGFAIIPGVTRSGVTMAALIWRKFSNNDVIKGSFLLAPIVSIGAFLLEFITGDLSLTQLDYTWIMVAMITAFLVSLLSIKIMLEIAKGLSYWKFLITIGSIMVAVNAYYLL